MKRIITGWFLIMLMTVFTVTAQSGLRFCLCKSAVVLGDCPCDQTRYSPPAASVPNKCASSSCNCCGKATQEKSNAPVAEHQQFISCSCMVDLSIQLNDFVVISDDPFRAELPSKTTPSLLYEEQAFTVPSVILARGTYTTRGSPPSLTWANVPIFIRDSVYRL